MGCLEHCPGPRKILHPHRWLTDQACLCPVTILSPAPGSALVEKDQGSWNVVDLGLMSGPCFSQYHPSAVGSKLAGPTPESRPPGFFFADPLMPSVVESAAAGPVLRQTSGPWPGPPPDPFYLVP